MPAPTPSDLLRPSVPAVLHGDGVVRGAEGYTRPVSATVLILGGYGTTGLMLSELLLEHSDARVVLAGRDLGRAERAAGELEKRYSGRVEARVADAADAASLEAALRGVDLVAVAASVLAHVRTVADTALRAGVDYFDLLLSSPAKLEVLESLRPRIEADGRCFVTDGGIHPGLSAVMVRALAPRFERLERAAIGGLIKADWNAYDFTLGTMLEFAEEMREYRTEAWRDGRWESLPWREATRRFDFGPPWGAERCFLMSLEELRRLPDADSVPARLRLLRRGLQPRRRQPRDAARRRGDEGRPRRARAALHAPPRVVAAALRPAAVRLRLAGRGHGPDRRGPP